MIPLLISGCSGEYFILDSSTEHLGSIQLSHLVTGLLVQTKVTYTYSLPTSILRCGMKVLTL
jgi:hypothetical protein